jgi:hypothetical protein
VIDPKKPFRINAPERLLIPVDDIALIDGAVRIKPTSKIDDEARRFFDDYQAKLSWAGGRHDAEQFLQEMHALPEEVKTVLRTDFKINVELPTDELVFKRFLSSRSIRYNGNNKDSVIMPMVEFANHSLDGLSFDYSSGIGLRGISAAPVLAKYNLHDCWSKLWTYGFAPVERWAFSLPIELASRDKKTRAIVGCSLVERETHPAGELVPKVKREDDRLLIPFFILGDRSSARRPVEIFREAIRPHLNDKSDEFFELLSILNRRRFLRLLSACNDGNSYGHRLLREAAIRQLEVLSSAVIVR